MPGKKKISIKEILPNFDEIKKRIFEEHETYDHLIKREFYVSRNQKASEESFFSINI